MKQLFFLKILFGGSFAVYNEPMSSSIANLELMINLHMMNRGKKNNTKEETLRKLEEHQGTLGVVHKLRLHVLVGGWSKIWKNYKLLGR